MKRLAIIGGGVAGLACLHFLKNHYQITLFEKNAYVGGHTNTIDYLENGRAIPVDTGFMVYNRITYPNLIRFFEYLDIQGMATDMSFSVQHIPETIEWNGAGWTKLFAQRRNLLNPRFYRFLGEVDRFNKLAKAMLEDSESEDSLCGQTMNDFIQAHSFSDDFHQWFLVPMSSAIWSTNPERLREFPILTLIRFFNNHGFLGLDDHYQWYTPEGGARRYVQKILKEFEGEVFTESPVISVLQEQGKAAISLASGETKIFDQVILACHADQALYLLSNPDPLQEELLSPFRYETNSTLLHTDSSVLPQRRRAWAAWNYRISEGSSPGSPLKSSVHYWMNRLQHLPAGEEVIVSLNADEWIDPSKIYYRTSYQHPIFTPEATFAQKRLSELNEPSPDRSVFFTGSYFRYGFHEDAFTASLNLVKTLTEQNNPWSLL